MFQPSSFCYGVKSKQSKTKTFLDPKALLLQVGLEEGMAVADFGCGNGYFAIAAAKMVGPNGQVYALDIQESMLSQTASQAKLERAYNVSTIQCDLEKSGSCGIDDQSNDLVIVSNLIHQTQQRENVFREAYRVLKTGGQVLVVEWGPDSPFGPPRAERIPESEIRDLLEKFGFKPVKDLQAGSFHYSLLYRK